MAIRNLSNITFFTFSPVVTKITLGPQGGAHGIPGWAPMGLSGPIGAPGGPGVALGDPWAPLEALGGALGNPWAPAYSCEPPTVVGRS